MIQLNILDFLISPILHRTVKTSFWLVCLAYRSSWIQSYFVINRNKNSPKSSICISLLTFSFSWTNSTSSFHTLSGCWRCCYMNIILEHSTKHGDHSLCGFIVLSTTVSVEQHTHLSRELQEGLRVWVIPEKGWDFGDVSPPSAASLTLCPCLPCSLYENIILWTLALPSQQH